MPGDITKNIQVTKCGGRFVYHFLAGGRLACVKFNGQAWHAVFAAQEVGCILRTFQVEIGNDHCLHHRRPDAPKSLFPMPEAAPVY